MGTKGTTGVGMTRTFMRACFIFLYACLMEKGSESKIKHEEPLPSIGPKRIKLKR